jgi:hypothetical protein
LKHEEHEGHEGIGKGRRAGKKRIEDGETMLSN